MLTFDDAWIEGAFIWEYAFIGANSVEACVGKLATSNICFVIFDDPM